MLNFHAIQFSLEVNANQPIESLAEKLSYGGKMLLVGIGVVFAVLISLWLALSIFNIVFGHAKAPSTQQTPKAEIASKEIVPSPVTTDENEQDEIVAVIAAAIAAASTENPCAKFRVVSFTRK